MAPNGNGERPPCRAVVVVSAYVPELGYDGRHGPSRATVTAVDLDFDPDKDRLYEPGDGGPGLIGTERGFAFLTLQVPLGEAPGAMGLDPAFKEGRANLSGYPSMYGCRLTNDVAWTYDDAADSYTDLRWFEAHPGNSGGPVRHHGPDGQPAVVGLVSTGRDGRGTAAFDIATSHAVIVGLIVSNDHLLA